MPDPQLTAPRHAAPIALRYGLEARPAPGAMLLFAMQHVMIMFGAMLASPLAISAALGLDPATRGAAVTGTMLGCGLGTVISALGVFGIGGRLPLLLGGYTVFIAPVVAVARLESLGAAVAAMMIGALVLLAASPLIGKLRRLFPPVVVGTLLLLTGISLVKLGVGLAVGANTPFFARPVTLVLLVASMLAIALIFAFGRGMTRLLAVFLTVVGVYLLAALLGLANPAPLFAAPWFAVPRLLPLGLAWPSLGAVAGMLVYYLAAAVYTTSITVALCDMLGVQGNEARVRGAVSADALGSVIATLFGGVPLISYDQNVGAVALTGVGSRFVVATSGALLVLLAFVPKAVALVTIVPPFVLGGTLIFMFGMIAAVGARILGPFLGNQRDQLVVALSVGLSAAVGFAPPQVFADFAPSLRVLLSDGIIVGTLAAVALNSVLPREGLSARAAAPETAPVD
jgi:uric acid transporter